MGRGIAPPETFPAVHPGHDTIALKQLILDGEIKVAGLESVLLQIGTVDLLNMFQQFRICIDDTPLYREHMLNKMLERIKSVVQAIRLKDFKSIIAISTIYPFPNLTKNLS